MSGSASTFKPIAQAVNRQRFAVLRFNKRGVLGVGPVLSDDPAQLYPKKPYEQVLRDAAAAVRFAQKQKRVDASRLFLLGHSEGTMVASNLAAAPQRFGIVEPAGVVTLGVVGGGPRETLYYQSIGAQLGLLHEEFDFDGDGRLAIDTEVEPIVRAGVGFDRYPHLPGAPKGLDSYLEDIARFALPADDLPLYCGPVLLLNGENDIQTRTSGAIATDAALTRAGHRDHQLITYPGLGHLMNLTSKYSPGVGNPDEAVIKDVTSWLAEHR